MYRFIVSLQVDSKYKHKLFHQGAVEKQRTGNYRNFRNSLIIRKQLPVVKESIPIASTMIKIKIQ